MPTLGEELKRRREERGITLNDISEATRIGTRFLKAIETDNFSILPGGIYTRNFIRSFAEQVGMREDEAIALYHQQVTGQPPEARQPQDSSAPASTPKRAQQPSEPIVRRSDPITYRQSPARTNWATVIIGVGIALFLALIVLAVIKKMEQGSGSDQSQTAASPPAPTEPAAPSSPSPSAPSPQQTSPATTISNTLHVKLEATEGDSYVRYQTDDAKPVTLTLRQGQSQEIPPAQNQIEIVYGNRLALRLTINDREAQFPAGSPKFSGKIVISRDTLDSYFQ